MGTDSSRPSKGCGTAYNIDDFHGIGHLTKLVPLIPLMADSAA